MQIEPETRCLIMLDRRGKAIAFYTVMFGFTVTLLLNPDTVDTFTAQLIVALFGLISLYYLVFQCFFFGPRFKYISAGINNEQTRRLINREGLFRRTGQGLFIVLAFAFIAYLGMY